MECRSLCCAVLCCVCAMAQRRLLCTTSETPKLNSHNEALLFSASQRPGLIDMPVAPARKKTKVQPEAFQNNLVRSCLKLFPLHTERSQAHSLCPYSTNLQRRADQGFQITAAPMPNMVTYQPRRCFDGSLCSRRGHHKLHSSTNSLFLPIYPESCRQP